MILCLVDPFQHCEHLVGEEEPSFLCFVACVPYVMFFFSLHLGVIGRLWSVIITKTCLFKYTENFPPKQSDIFFIFLLKT